MSELVQALEAILFSSNRALRVRELQQATETGGKEVHTALDELAAALSGRGLMLQRQGDLVQLVTRPEVASYVRRALRPEVTGTLSSAAYATLAIVTYQHPVTKSRNAAIRGVNRDHVVAHPELRDRGAAVGRGWGPVTSAQ